MSKDPAVEATTAAVENLALSEENQSSKQKYVEKKKKQQQKEEKLAARPAVKELVPPPDFIASREALWARLKAERDEWLAAQPREAITITLPDGKEVSGESWSTTPYDVAAGISKGLADNSVVCKVNGELWDLDRPLEASCTLSLIKFDDEEGQAVFWHSSAHVLGEAMEKVYAGHLCYGPPIESGFYYDMFSDDYRVSDSDFKVLDGVVKKISKEKQPFERLEMKKSDLLEMFSYNQFKVRILNEKVKTETTTVYKCGSLIDLCRGPHVRHTGKIKAMEITKNSATYWEGNAEAESLQRIYGISFPDNKQLKEWRQFQEEAAKRDHRKLGKEQELFFFHELSPGSCFFQPKGAFIYNSLVKFIREEYWKRGFQEVISPNIYNAKLWQTSGHWDHYAENMFKIDVEKEQFGLKPMNCPGHCLIFDHGIRSWRYHFLQKFTISKSHFSQCSHFQNLIFPKIHIFKTSFYDKIHNFTISFFTKFTFSKCDFPKIHNFKISFFHKTTLSKSDFSHFRDLPLRMADFGVLHRNELSGALTGLTRVRRFQQDDAHIFCMPEQIKDEMRGALDFLQHIYSTFGFTYQLKLSTRPESYLGDIEVWNRAEKMMEESLNESGLPWKLNPGDGAFYGPKIDITLMDALRRQHQCATIQLDFQLPIRFNLNYIDEKGEKKHPVIIHRAILGSVERMVAVLLESFGGKWPFWLSPRQAMVVPVAAPFNDYAQTVRKQLKEAGFMCEANVDNTETMNKKVRNAQLAQFNFIFGKNFLIFCEPIFDFTY